MTLPTMAIQNPVSPFTNPPIVNTPWPIVKALQKVMIEMLELRRGLRDSHFINHQAPKKREDDIWVGVDRIEEIIFKVTVSQELFDLF